ncbi:PREDICTED: transcriptional regulator of yeast form adherence 4-like [Polistes dominula]|uniref:Transcriptional regulator of yeast form adherence 4-like n=1 Tax=Polistes dominula TaxID=743375 RepID=A0ABM1IEF1_POLDO|nr:PREDICTED: transcriptional regulator of yeast form adherence 4-like [Polistes dominula]
MVTTTLTPILTSTLTATLTATTMTTAPLATAITTITRTTTGSTSLDMRSSIVNVNQNNIMARHPCPKCYRSYKHRSHMIRHLRYECGISQRFKCPYCKQHLRQRTHVWTHIRTLHPNQELYCIDIDTNTRLPKREYRNE